MNILFVRAVMTNFRDITNRGGRGGGHIRERGVGFKEFKSFKENYISKDDRRTKESEFNGSLYVKLQNYLLCILMCIVRTIFPSLGVIVKLKSTGYKLLMMIIFHLIKSFMK